MEKKTWDLKHLTYLTYLLFCVFQVSNLKGQVYTMPTGSIDSSVTTCSGTFYDSGGPTSNYANGSSSTYTFCSNTPGQCITVDFTQFNVNDIIFGTVYDYLSVYDGPIVNPATYMFDISGGPFPTSFPVASSSGCLTFEFISDGSNRDPGWTGLISCQPCPIPATFSQQDCNGAIPICLEQYYQPNGYIGNNGSDIVPAGSCLQDGELNNSWYVFTAASSGNLSFIISPNLSDDDYDWALYDITNDGCDGISDGSSAEISCNYSFDVGTWAGQTGAYSATPYFGSGNSATDVDESFNASIPVTAGNSYAILVSNFDASQGGYFIDLSPSTASLFDNVAPVVESVSSDDCVGVTFQMEFSEPTLCSSIQAGDFSITGPGGPYTITSINVESCTGGGTQFSQELTFNVSPAITIIGTYNLCITNTAGGISDLCGNTSTSGCINFAPNSSLTANAGANVSNCANSGQVIIGGSPTATGGAGSYTYSWLPATGIISGATSANPIVGPTANTVYTVTVTDANGCTATDQVNVNFTPFTPTTISYAGAPFCTNITTSQLPTFTGITGGTYSASPSGLSINTSTGAIVPSTSTAGTYTITYTVAGSGICPAISVIQTVVINNLPATPTVTPTLPCAGVPLTFTAGNGALYEFTINGTSQGIPSSTNTFTSPVLVTGDEVCVISYPPPPFLFEGNFSEPEWGNPIAKSTGGPANSGFGPGNNLDALYVNNIGNFLNVGIAANLVNGSNNKILLFIDCRAGGVNNLGAWIARSNAPYYSMENLNSSITFDAGFFPDYILGVNQAFGDVFFDLYDIPNNSSVFLGSANGSPNFGFIGNAGVGVFTQGFEFKIPMNELGNPTGNISFFTMMVNDPGQFLTTFVSNQFLTPAGPNENNYGSVSINFGFGRPNPVTYSLSADCFSQTCVTAINPITPTFNQVAAICSGATLSALPTTSTNGITGTWSPAINNTTTTTYTFTPAAGVCATTATMTITVNAIPSVLSALPSYSTCSGPTLPTASTSTINLTTNPLGASINWTGSNGSSGTGSPIANAIPNNTCTDQVVNYTITPSLGTCTGTALVVPVTIRPKPIATFTVSPNPICLGQNATVTFVGTSCPGSTYNWTWPAGVNVISGTGAGPYTIGFASATTYNISLQIVGPASLGSCTSPLVTLPVTVNAPTVPTFTALSPFCTGQTAPLLVNTSNNSITGSWSPLTVNNTSSATYTFTPTSGQCATTTTLNSTVNPIPITTPIYHD